MYDAMLIYGKGFTFSKIAITKCDFSYESLSLILNMLCNLCTSIVFVPINWLVMLIVLCVGVSLAARCLVVLRRNDCC